MHKFDFTSLFGIRTGGVTYHLTNTQEIFEFVKGAAILALRLTGRDEAPGPSARAPETDEHSLQGGGQDAKPSARGAFDPHPRGWGDLADRNREQGQHEHRKHVYSNSLALAEKRLGPDHPEIADADQKPPARTASHPGQQAKFECGLDVLRYGSGG